MNAQTIVTPSGERLVILPEAEFDALMAAAEDAADGAAVGRFRAKLERGEEELVPAEIIDRILAGEGRVRVWREHRGMTAAALAEQAGIAPDLLAAIEGATHEASVDTLRRIGSALGVSLDDLAG